MTSANRPSSENTAPRFAKPLRLTQRIGYGSGDLAFLLVWQGSALFLLYFYTDVLGLSPWLAGAIFMIAMIWDAVSDPLIATWSERRVARTGRYAPIIAIAALPVGLGYALMFAAPVTEAVLAAAWALVTHLAFRTAYTFASMPYNTLPARLTTDGQARSVLSAFRVAGAAVGAVLAAVATPAIVQASASERSGYLIAALVTGSLAALLLIVSSRTCGEQPRFPAHAPATSYLTDLVAMARGTLRNPPMLRLVGVMALGTIGYAFFTSAILYFLTHVIEEPDLTGAVLGVSALATVLAAPVWAIVAARTSKRTAMIAGVAVSAAGYLLLALGAGNSILLVFVAVAIAGAGGTAIPVMLWSMVPDAVDHGQAETGMRIEARSFGVMTFVQKTSAGVTVLLAGGLLALTGYSASESPSPNSLLAVIAMVSWLPAVFMVAIIAVIRLYPIDRTAHSRTLKALGETQGE